MVIIWNTSINFCLLIQCVFAIGFVYFAKQFHLFCPRYFFSCIEYHKNLLANMHIRFIRLQILKSNNQPFSIVNNLFTSSFTNVFSFQHIEIHPLEIVFRRL